MAAGMILGLSHDTCPVCGKDIRLRKDLTLFHHGHPADRCAGMGFFGVRVQKFMEDQADRHGIPRMR
jgi:hypothetical protein